MVAVLQKLQMGKLHTPVVLFPFAFTCGVTWRGKDPSGEAELTQAAYTQQMWACADTAHGGHFGLVHLGISLVLGYYSHWPALAPKLWLSHSRSLSCAATRACRMVVQY